MLFRSIFCFFVLSLSAVHSSSSILASYSAKPITQENIQNILSKILLLENEIKELKSYINKELLEVNRSGNSPDTNNDVINDKYQKSEIIDNSFRNQNKTSSEALIEENSITTTNSEELSIKVEYEKALAELKSKQFTLAESLFYNFIQKYPENILQSNAMFWYAETFYQRKIYNKAAIHYIKGYKKFPKGNKAADSLLKASFSFSKLNKNLEACKILHQLDLEFPNRSEHSIKRSESAKAEFLCNGILDNQ
ncbi:tol-pal system protein YbgF [Rickettsia endosymbiont of Cardiosporidium cionae]|uniref:tol-pal system protein YbgF n=1 Tax=Rickettsia endosymbiont of Cardiosporidium cionae TaxID=2777155 RepID=UPI001894E6CF|nr:tol-pal system protein YbgF [Rickettsia endosymbiont of Cardiosporidium cionae]KAF8818985.1 tol-pal system protein YbgF [Rickettsia endosymbiont of Cardiosporidium cionae]